MAVFGHGGRDRVAHRVFLADVAGVETRTPTVSNDLVRRGLQLVDIAPHQHHMRAQTGQFVRGAAADARSAAGDQHHLPGQQVRRKHGTVAARPLALNRHVGSFRKSNNAVWVRSSSEAWRPGSNHCTDQFKAPNSISRASPGSPFSSPLACSACSTGTQAAS
ncbi:hypothetical protein FQZ97_856960 [compost metagenome]